MLGSIVDANRTDAVAYDFHRTAALTLNRGWGTAGWMIPVHLT